MEFNLSTEIFKKNQTNQSMQHSNAYLTTQKQNLRIQKGKI